MNANCIKYDYWQEIGNNGVRFIRDVPYKAGTGRKACFLCPECGKEFIALISSIKRKTNPTVRCQSCSRKKSNKNIGSAQIRNLTGQRFGKITVLNIKNKRDNNNRVYWHCKCDCGTEKDILGYYLTKGEVCSCGCSTMSKGEQLIYDILIENNLVFEQQKTFNNCINPKTNKKLRFDFYLPDYNCCIEYDGEQHYYFSNSVNTWNNFKHFQNVQYLDNIKNEYCKNNNIKLIRIPYLMYSKIHNNHSLLVEFISTDNI